MIQKLQQELRAKEGELRHFRNRKEQHSQMSAICRTSTDHMYYNKRLHTDDLINTSQDFQLQGVYQPAECSSNGMGTPNHKLST